MSSLTEFLLVRIAEDEQAARHTRNGFVLASPRRGGRELVGNHFARWTPDRVLAECAAKRQIITEHAPMDSPYVDYQHCRMCVRPGGWDYGNMAALVGIEYPCLTLRYLAAPYSSHPDFDPSWGVTP